jgi:hypothetical protein
VHIIINIMDRGTKLGRNTRTFSDIDGWKDEGRLPPRAAGMM